MNFLKLIKMQGKAKVGPSADWVNEAYRISGNEEAGVVITDTENGDLLLLEYHHNEEGERINRLVGLLPEVSWELLTAYRRAVIQAVATSGGHCPVGCLEIAAEAAGIAIVADVDSEEAMQLIGDLAEYMDSLRNNASTN